MHRDHFRTRTILCVVTLVAISIAAEANDAVGVWQRWEHRLVSDKDYPNPCTDVTLGVRFEGPRGQVSDGLGYWDGGRQFVIRCAFPSPGEWRWSTTCSDTADGGLHGQSGAVRVRTDGGENPLTRHGYLRVSDDRRLLVHADGTPFLWLGDTCWAAPALATEEDWKQYVRNRTSQGYSVLQLSVAPEWALERAKGGAAAFLSTLPDITKPNPRFFQKLDRMLALANDRGLVIMMCGLMETPHRYPPPEQVAVLSRYVAARYASFAVIFSPSFDSGIHDAETKASATAIREAAPANLVTMHMGTAVGPRFHAEDWLSFDMFQSGHNGGDRGRQSMRAIGMPAEILALSPRKPIINGEAIYEGEYGGAYDVRRTAWLSFLSGAMGYTAGIDEIYAWEEDAPVKMNVPSSGQVALVGQVLRNVSWWELEPAPNRVLNQPDDGARRMAFALMTDKKLGIAYLPQDDIMELDLSGCAPAYDALWINPATGETHTGAEVTSANATALAAPDKRDWVVLLAAPGSPVVADVTKVLAAAKFHRTNSPATITFDKKEPVKGLVRKAPGDGVLVYATYKGVRCVVNEKPQRNSYLYMDVDDRLAFRGGPARMRVEVRIQSDEQLDGVQLQYDAIGADEVANMYRPAAEASRRQHGAWTTMEFVAESPYLGNRQNGGADFRLYLGGRLCRVASVKVTLDNAETTRR